MLPGKSLSEAAMGWLFSITALSGYVDVITSNLRRLERYSYITSRFAQYGYSILSPTSIGNMWPPYGDFFLEFQPRASALQSASGRFDPW